MKTLNFQVAMIAQVAFEKPLGGGILKLHDCHAVAAVALNVWNLSHEN